MATTINSGNTSEQADKSGVTGTVKEGWRDAKIAYADAGQKLRDIDRDWKVSDRYADLKDRLTHARVKSDSLATADFRKQFEMSMAYHSVHPEFIDDRLDDLDDEWSAEQAMLAIGGGLAAIGGIFSVTRSRLWTALPLAISFAMLRGLQKGEMPSIAFLRRAGLRSRDEIEQERYALKALRGDFADVDQAEGHDEPGGSNPANLSKAVKS